MLKIHRGTRPDGESPLCVTCQKGTVMRGAAESQESIHCGEVGKFLKMRVVECNDYLKRGEVQLHDMKCIAWVLSTDKAKNKIGFQKYSDWRSEHKGELLLPDDY